MATDSLGPSDAMFPPFNEVDEMMKDFLRCINNSKHKYC